MLLGESRRLQGRKEAHVTSRQARAVAGLAFRDQSPPSESAPAAWAQRNPRPGAFGVKKRTLNSPFQTPNFSSSWLGNASDVRHLHSNPADFKHFPFWARSSESGNEFPTPFSPRRSPASNLSASRWNGLQVWEGKNLKECSGEGMKRYHWNLYLWEEKGLKHYLRMLDYNISRI